MADERDRRREGPARPSADERGRYVVLPELVRMDTLINVGLIVLGVYILQAFISNTVTDVAARVSIAAWAVAIPLLAFLILLSQLLGTYRYASNPPVCGSRSRARPGCGDDRLRGSRLARVDACQHRLDCERPGGVFRVPGVPSPSRTRQSILIEI